jgi:hypothetical protein
MRALLAFFLCLSVAFQGIANASAFKHPCPMEQGAQAMMMDGSDSGGDCCNDAETAAKTGKLCKTGQAGNFPSPGALASAPAPMQTPASSRLVATATPIPLSADSASVWRPPTIS